METLENELIFIENAKSSDLPQVVKILEQTQSDIVRNAAALAISDLKGNIYLPELVNTIKRKSVKSKGTLIYALSMMDAERYFTSIGCFILDRNLEIQMEAMSFIIKFKKKALIEELHFIKNLLKENSEVFFDENDKKRLMRLLNYEIKKHAK